MIIPGNNLVKRKHAILMICGTMLLVVSYMPAFAQEDPPKPIMVISTSQNLNFGTFIQGGNYGTVTVPATGPRTATGSVILPNISSGITPTPALFKVEAIPGTLITISNGLDAILAGSNSGSLTLHIEASYPQSPFIATGPSIDVAIGGTLTVGPLSANPAGNYSGSFTVTFIQQ